jgi:hypothetical protein
VDVIFNSADIASATVASSTSLKIVLNAGSSSNQIGDYKLEQSINFDSTSGAVAGGDKLIISPNASSPTSLVMSQLDMPSSIDLGTVSGVRLNLINPVKTASGKTYYYLDHSGNGSNDSSDALTHNLLDSLLNGGNDTANTVAANGVDDARTVVISGAGGLTLALPTLSELLDLYNDPLPNPPTGWNSSTYYWSATQSSSGNHTAFNLASGIQANVPDTDIYFVAFQVL